jgi:tryptophan halogenase
MTDQRLRKIVIVGGGTAGWMTAAALGRFLKDGHTQVTLVESEEIGTIGVGESTIPQINIFNRMLGLDENEFVRRTKATFKLAIDFVDWKRIGHSYYHPFGPYGVDMEGVSFHAYWLRLKAMGEAADLTDYSLQALAADQGKFMRANGQPTRRWAPSPTPTTSTPASTPSSCAATPRSAGCAARKARSSRSTSAPRTASSRP